MDTNGHELILKEEVYEIVGCAMEVLNDLIAYGKLVVDKKVIERITDHELGQMMNYLKITGLQVGIILNFKQATLEWKRVVL